MSLPPDWIELLGLLEKHRARYLVVGAHALAVAGRPRATQDLDIFVEPTAKNARLVCAALSEFGFPALGRAVEDFATPERMATLGRVPYRVDIMTSISGVSFRAGWAGRVRAELDGQHVSVLGRRELLRNKKASGRDKDLLDVALLAEVAAPPKKKAASKVPRQRSSARG